ncbi:MAG: tetratricopeptide repeat protein [Bacteroidota bacterium]
MKILCALLILLPAPAYTSRSQDVQTRFRLAQSYEHGGDFESAARLYREIYAKDRANAAVFEALRRTLVQLKRYDEAGALIEERLVSHPSDVNLLCLLGGVRYRGGREEEAFATWERALQAGLGSQQAYRAVAGVLMENRLLDRAASLYRRARAESGDSLLFTTDLAGLLAAGGEYAGATREYIRYLEKNPAQIGFIQGRMAAYTGKPEGTAEAVAAVEAALERRKDLPLTRLLGWLTMEAGDFDRALEVHRAVDALAGARGAELFAFAERAFRERAYGASERAYGESVEAGLEASRVPQARLGRAMALLETASLPDTIRPAPRGGSTSGGQRFAAAVEAFREIIRDYPRTEFSARAWRWIGLVQYERFGDPQSALASLKAAEGDLRGTSSLAHDIGLMIGRVLESQGDTAGATLRFRTVAEAPRATPDQQDEATFRLAELAYFAGSFDRAEELLRGITLNLKADYANDALRLLAFLGENGASAPEDLREFARAAWTARTAGGEDAAALFRRIPEGNPRSPLADDALMEAAALLVQAGRAGEAAALYREVLDRFGTTSTLLDRAQFALGEVCQFALGDRAGAVAAYETLLADYPQSLLAEEARRRIRSLRGDVP